MKNSFIIILLLMTFSCKKQDFSIQSDQEPTRTNAFVTNHSFINNITRNDSIFEEILTDGTLVRTFIQTKFTFNLALNFYSIQREAFTDLPKTPTISAFSAYQNNFFLPVENTAINVFAENTQANSAPYQHLIISNPKQDANAIYFAATGFFLNHYFEAEAIAGNQVQMGFYDNNTEALTIAPEDKITPFLSLSANPEKNERFTFPVIEVKHIINQIDAGIEALIGNPNINKQLTILTYGLYSTLTNSDSLALADTRNNLFAQNITLNVITLLPTPFLQPITYKTGGFFQNDIPYILADGDLSGNIEEFENIVNTRIFPSSGTIHNLQRLVNGSAKTNNYATITGTFVTTDSITADSARHVLEKQTYLIRWNDIEEHIPPAFEIRPTTL